MSKKVLVIGGLGFIGYHISNVLSNSDLETTIAHRSNSPENESEYDLIHLDLNSMSVEVVKELLKPFDFVVFCGGADDRRMPVGDAKSYFYQENVASCLKLVEASSKSAIQKVVILGSYFTHFDRTIPEWNLKEKHTYVASRYLQQTETIKLAQNGLQVSTIEIPPVFGSAPGKTPLWKPLVDYIHKMPFVLYCKGGTNIMSVTQLAQATLGVLHAKEYRPYWVVGSENVSWTKFVQMISGALGKKKKVVLIPNFILKTIVYLVKVYFKLAKKQTGLDPYSFIDVQTSNAFLDVEDSMKNLGYGKVDMQKSINDMVRACGYQVKD